MRSQLQEVVRHTNQCPWQSEIVEPTHFRDNFHYHRRSHFNNPRMHPNQCLEPPLARVSVHSRTAIYGWRIGEDEVARPLRVMLLFCDNSHCSTSVVLPQTSELH